MKIYTDLPYVEEEAAGWERKKANIDKSYPTVEDNVFFKDTGPIAGILTTFDKFPGKKDRTSDEGKSWIGSTEEYTFKEKNGKTELKVTALHA